MLKEAVQTVAESPFKVLTPREHEVLGLMAQGFKNDVIANTLVIEKKTVENLISDMYSRLGMATDPTFHRRVKVVLWYQEHDPDFKNPLDEIDGELSFTPREQEVISLAGQGYSNGAIANRLHIEAKTVTNFITTILDKIQVDYQQYNYRTTIALVSQTKHLANNRT